MGSGDQGFASLSTAKKRVVSSKGGKTAHQKGVAHTFDEFEAKQASIKGVAARRKKRALEAAKRLMLSGFSIEDLLKLNLTVEEYLYYGGAKSPQKRIKALHLKLAGLTSEFKEGDPF